MVEFLVKINYGYYLVANTIKKLHHNSVTFFQATLQHIEDMLLYEAASNDLQGDYEVA